MVRPVIYGSLDCAVGVGTGLLAGRPRNRVSITGVFEARLQSVQNSSVPHGILYSVGAGILSSGVSRPWPEADHSIECPC